jgi:hypothetical protein
MLEPLPLATLVDANERGENRVPGPSAIARDS